MSAGDLERKGSTGSQPPPSRRRTVLQATASILATLLVAGVFCYWYLRGHADQIIRRRMIDTLQARFRSPVEIAELHLSIRHGIKVSGGGLRILSLAGPTGTAASGERMQPTVLHVASFGFVTNFAELLKPTMRIVTVYVDGLELDIPPSGERGWKAHKGNGESQPPGAIVIDQVICTNAKIVIEPKQAGKPPLVFNVASLKLHDVGERKPLGYEAILTNPKPVGDVHATGHFGPWVAGRPRDTPLDGTYSFLHADLGTIRGMGGTLTSTGSFTGRLGSLTVTGETQTPDLTLTVSQHPVPVHATFIAAVDGTTGDTYLRQVDAQVLHTGLHAVGSVVRVGTPTAGVTGHAVDVTVTAGPGDHARIEDMLLLGLKKSPPFMRGAMTMQIHVYVPPGHASLKSNVLAKGWLKIHDVTFSSSTFQQTVDRLSGRADKSKAPKGSEPLAPAAIEGQYDLEGGILHVPTVSFSIPGAAAVLNGQYLISQKTVDFKGLLRTEASASAMTTGWKSLLLTPFDPLLKKNGAGMQIPITVSGSRSAMKFGVDLKRLLH